MDSTAITGRDLTHKNPDPTVELSHDEHAPSVCNNALNCDARDSCGHAKSHTHEFMYESCSGRQCDFLRTWVKCE